MAMHDVSEAEVSKKRHMVKLSVIVANRASKAEIIEGALILRRQLEDLAGQGRGGRRQTHSAHRAVSSATAHG